MEQRFGTNRIDIEMLREHITWFSFEGKFAGDYPACLDGRPAQTTIEAMMSSRILSKIRKDITFDTQQQ